MEIFAKEKFKPLNGLKNKYIWRISKQLALYQLLITLKNPFICLSETAISPQLIYFPIFIFENFKQVLLSF